MCHRPCADADDIGSSRDDNCYRYNKDEKQMYSLRKQVSDLEGAMHLYLGTQIRARA